MTTRLRHAVAAVCQQRWLLADLDVRTGTISPEGRSRDAATWRDFVGQPHLELMEAAEAAGVWTPPASGIFA